MTIESNPWSRKTAAEEKLITSPSPKSHDLVEYLEALEAVYSYPPTDPDMVQKLREAIDKRDRDSLVVTQIQELEKMGSANVSSAHLLDVPSLARFGHRQLQITASLKAILNSQLVVKGWLEEAFG